jgi:hypothetical protein
MRLASIFDTPFDDVKQYYKDAKVDVVTGIASPSEMGFFDVVTSCHKLQQHPQTEVLPALMAWKAYLKPKGEMFILVPSLEWSAKAIIRNDFNPLIIPSIFGMNGENKTGFTLPVLRRFMELAGFRVVVARSGEYTVSTSKGNYTAEQHLVKGVLA